MFVKAIKIAKEAMFPIFKVEKISSSQSRIGVAGAGFFINAKGYFVTVAHVFDSMNKQTLFKYHGLLPDNVHNPAITIIEVAKDDDNDIFIGRLKGISSKKYFHLANILPEVGKSICIGGYPLAQISNNAKGGLELGGVRRYFQPSFVLDKIVINSDGAKRTRKHDGFLVRDIGLFGMSGGPVFDMKGKVLGVQGSVTQPRVSRGSGGREIEVENAIVIKSKTVISLLKANKIRFNFLGIL